MINADICSLLETLNRLITMRDFSQDRAAQQQLPMPEISSDDKEAFLEVVDAMAAACSDMGLNATKNAAWWAKFKTEPLTLSHVDIYHHTDAIYGALVIETANARFLKIDTQRISYYSQADDPKRIPPFGEDTEKAFPQSVPEIVAACNCFALELWTASVFHSMRVLETSLVSLAKKFAVPYDSQNWHNIIEGIESAVRSIDLTYGSDWKEDQKFFGETARHFMFIKNAWRNHVMHVRDEYDEGKALSILQHVKELTTHLALRLSA